MFLGYMRVSKSDGSQLVDLQRDALRGLNKPVGVAGYSLTKDLPDKLKNALPSVDQLKEKILFELGVKYKNNSIK